MKVSSEEHVMCMSGTIYKRWLSKGQYTASTTQHRAQCLSSSLWMITFTRITFLSSSFASITHAPCEWLRSLIFLYVLFVICRASVPFIHSPVGSSDKPGTFCLGVLIPKSFALSVWIVYLRNNNNNKILWMIEDVLYFLPSIDIYIFCLRPKNIQPFLFFLIQVLWLLKLVARSNQNYYCCLEQRPSERSDHMEGGLIHKRMVRCEESDRSH